MAAGSFETVFAALEGANVRYLVVDGVAVVLHGHPRDLGDVRVWVASMDDLVAMKRRAGRPQDLEDVRNLEAIARTLEDDDG